MVSRYSSHQLPALGFLSNKYEPLSPALFYWYRFKDSSYPSHGSYFWLAPVYLVLLMTPIDLDFKLVAQIDNLIWASVLFVDFQIGKDYIFSTRVLIKRLDVGS